MNIRFVLNQLGLVAVVLGALMLLTAAVFVLSELLAGHPVDRESQAALFVSAGAALIGGVGLWLATRGPAHAMGRRDAILLVALTWICGSALAALPFWAWAHLHFASVPPAEAIHPFLSFIDCYFEAVSGMTTTGSTVLTNIEVVPRNLLLWRATTQWLGGIGIVVLFVAVFPAVGVGARKLYQFETSGVTKQGVLPTIRATAQALLGIYIALTAAEVVALRIAGMSWFDAICHSFTTLATGGYSPYNASVGAFRSVTIDIIVALFMVLGGVNFAIFHQLARGRVREAWRDPELRLYLALVLGGSLLVALVIVGKPLVLTTGDTIGRASAWEALRHSLFNVSSVQTTTGFATADYNLWPNFARGVMVALIFIGGCAGSTAGGIKVIRTLVCAKALMNMVERAFRPQVIRPIRVGSSTVDDQIQLATFGFVVAAIVMLSAGTFAVMALEPRGAIDLGTAASANAATFFTIGPGFGRVGPVANYGWLSAGSKLVLCGMMLLGRLELITILAVLLPGFWRKV